MTHGEQGVDALGPDEQGPDESDARPATAAVEQGVTNAEREARRADLNAGLAFVLSHDAELLKRLA